MRDFDNKEFFSDIDEGDRRAGLRRLDDVLQALEELNLREAGVIPASLREKLIEEGIQIHGSSITELDLVLANQQQFLLQERRTGPRRRRRPFLPTADELASMISRRHHR